MSAAFYQHQAPCVAHSDRLCAIQTKRTVDSESRTLSKGPCSSLMVDTDPSRISTSGACFRTSRCSHYSTLDTSALPKAWPRAKPRLRPISMQDSRLRTRAPMPRHCCRTTHESWNGATSCFAPVRSATSQRCPTSPCKSIAPWKRISLNSLSCATKLKQKAITDQQLAPSTSAARRSGSTLSARSTANRVSSAPVLGRRRTSSWKRSSPRSRLSRLSRKPRRAREAFEPLRTRIFYGYLQLQKPSLLSNFQRQSAAAQERTRRQSVPFLLHSRLAAVRLRGKLSKPTQTRGG